MARDAETTECLLRPKHVVIYNPAIERRSQRALSRFDMYAKGDRIMSRRTILWIALLLATPLWAQQASMAVVEKKAGMVAFYTADGKRLSAVKVGLYPHEMAFSPDRRLLYVSDNGVEWMTDTGKGDNTLSVIDVATLKKVGVIDLGNYYRPHGMLVLPKTGHLVVTIENPDGL